MKLLKQHLSDNHADLHMERMIGIAIAFVAGGLMIVGIMSALHKHYATGLDSNIHSYLD
ncbi:MAG: hypothetical protein IJZ68_07035 [Bacteroidaceae bacterium]|nr:hypothetical protein [Bacteroidaceae bacterium]